MMRSWRAFMMTGAGLLLVAGGGTPATAAEPMPEPKIEFSARGTFVGGGEMHMRHREGMLRIDMDMPGVGLPVVGYFDLRTRKALVVAASPVGKLGLEVPDADQVSYGVTGGNGERGAQATIAGETCDLWSIDTGKASTVTSCITADGIALRTEVITNEKRELVFEIATVSRAPQDAALFVPPTDIKMVPVKMRPPGRGAAPGR